jgi:hypothetical protein
MSAAKIAATLQAETSIKEARAAGIFQDPPNVRTVGRRMTEFLAWPDEDRVAYRSFSWPESMDSHALPWEASPACLELLALYLEKGWLPPTNDLMERYWRVTQAAPGADLSTRLGLAIRLVIYRKLSRPMDLDRVGRYIATQGWRSTPVDRALPFEFTEEQLKQLDTFFPQMKAASIVNRPLQRRMSRLRKGSGERIPAAEPESIDPASLAAEREISKVRTRRKRKES